MHNEHFRAQVAEGEQVEQRGCGTSSEYVRELIRKEQERAQLRKLLLEGANSGRCVKADEAFFKRLRKRADA